jgi:hypothetical protein
VASFKGGVSGAAPLQVQLSMPANSVGRVLDYAAAGENAVGSASRPVLSRPSTLGSGSGTAVPMDGYSTAQGVVVTSFSSAPTLPVVGSGALNLPIRVRWAAPREQSFVIYGGGGALLYAAASGGHAWTGSMIWEEA